MILSQKRSEPGSGTGSISRFGRRLQRAHSHPLHFICSTGRPGMIGCPALPAQSIAEILIPPTMTELMPIWLPNTKILIGHLLPGEIEGLGLLHPTSKDAIQSYNQHVARYPPDRFI